MHTHARTHALSHAHNVQRVNRCPVSPHSLPFPPRLHPLPAPPHAISLAPSPPPPHTRPRRSAWPALHPRPALLGGQRPGPDRGPGPTAVQGRARAQGHGRIGESSVWCVLCCCNCCTVRWEALGVMWHGTAGSVSHTLKGHGRIGESRAWRVLLCCCCLGDAPARGGCARGGRAEGGGWGMAWQDAGTGWFRALAGPNTHRQPALPCMPIAHVTVQAPPPALPRAACALCACHAKAALYASAPPPPS